MTSMTKKQSDKDDGDDDDEMREDKSMQIPFTLKTFEGYVEVVLI